MILQHAIRLLQEACALQHTALSTEKTYTSSLRHYARFLQSPQAKSLLTTEAKLEAFLTQLALRGVSASTQNQAFNALLFFYRYALKQKLGNVHALRAKRPDGLRYCPDRGETLQLLASVGDLYGYPWFSIPLFLIAASLRSSLFRARTTSISLNASSRANLAGSVSPFHRHSSNAARSGSPSSDRFISAFSRWLASSLSRANTVSQTSAL
jgi:integrase-like protein